MVLSMKMPLLLPYELLEIEGRLHVQTTLPGNIGILVRMLPEITTERHVTHGARVTYIPDVWLEIQIPFIDEAPQMMKIPVENLPPHQRL